MIIRTAQDAAELFAPFFESTKDEKLVVAHLDRDQNILALGEEGPGSNDEVELPVRSIIAEGLRLGSRGMVVGHNHPSGDPTPSEADKAATRRLADTARSVGIRLYDHLIFAGDECRSFRELGLL